MGAAAEIDIRMSYRTRRSDSRSGTSFGRHPGFTIDNSVDLILSPGRAVKGQAGAAWEQSDHFPEVRYEGHPERSDCGTLVDLRGVEPLTS